jgi:hypothetical protein
VFLRDLCALLSVVSVLSFPERRQAVALGLRNRALKKKEPRLASGRTLLHQQVYQTSNRIVKSNCGTGKLLTRGGLACDEMWGSGGRQNEEHGPLNVTMGVSIRLPGHFLAIRETLTEAVVSRRVLREMEG